MTKPPPASPPSSDKANSPQDHSSPEKKKQKKRHDKTITEESLAPTKLFEEFTTTKIDPQPLWKTLTTLHSSNGNPYTSSQLFAESGRSLHQDSAKACSLLAKLLKKDPSIFRKTVPTQSNWETLFTKATTKTKPLSITDTKFLTKMLMDLSSTSPFPLFQPFRLSNGNLQPTLMTSIWFSAQKLCGSNYTSPKTPPAKPTKGSTTITSYLSALNNKTDESKPAASSSNPRNPYKPPSIPTTPKASNQKTPQLPSRKHRERYDMKLFIDPAEQNPVTGFVSRIKEWFTTAKSTDPTLAILPWFKASKLKPILSPSTIPTEMKVLRNYFQRLSPKGGIIWTKVHLMLDQPPKEITSGPTTQMGWWYKEHDEGLYLRPLRDAETTQDLGILAYTSNFTNADHTMELINSSLKEQGCKFTIGGKLRPIKSLNITEKLKTQHKAKGGTWQNQYWFALHLIADVNHQRQAIRHLYRLFNQKDHPQPGGLRSRFIPHEGVITMSSSASGKRFKMINKHKAVVQSLQMIRTDSIITLDEPNKPTNYTLRHFLSSLKHSESGRPLFHSIDFSSSFLDEGSNTVIITAHKEHANEAAALVSVLPALCQQKLHPSTAEWFTVDAIEHCDGVIFEENSYRFQSREDFLFDDMLDEDFGSEATMQFEGLKEALNSSQSPSTKPTTDDTSFVSFGTMMDAKKSNPPSSIMGTDSMSTPSFLTTSINENQEDSMAATNAENEELRRQVRDLLLEKAQWTTNSDNPPGTTTPPDSNTNYSPTFQPSPSAGTRSKSPSPKDD